MDLAAPAGTPVMAPAASQVRFAGSVAGKPVVSLSHTGGLVTTYEPVIAAVTAGDQVRPGEVIGTLAPGHGQPEGTGGGAGGSHGTGAQPLGMADSHAAAGVHPAGTPVLHWGARLGRDTYVNPLRLVCAPRIRLKPVTPAT